MNADALVIDLAEAGNVDRARVGGKAGVLGELVAAGLPVPPGAVVTAAALDTDGWETCLEAAARDLSANRLAVRSSGAAEDLPDASYAGLYETYLDVPVEGLGQAVRRCFAAAASQRVSAYHQRHGGGAAGMAVLVQAMVHPMAAGVAFTAHPVTGNRDQAVVTAVAGLGDPLVSGEAVGEEWTVAAGSTRMTRATAAGDRVLTARQAQAAELAWPEWFGGVLCVSRDSMAVGFRRRQRGRSRPDRGRGCVVAEVALGTPARRCQPAA